MKKGIMKIVNNHKKIDKKCLSREEFMKKLIIIPAYNEAENLPKIISGIENLLPGFDYVIINDGSVDNTRKVCEANQYNVVNLPINSGIGVAVQTGYKYALYNDYDIAIQIDGDGQHDVSYLEKIVAPLESNEADVVIGSRFIEYQGFQSSGARRMGIKLLSFFIWLCTGQKVKDVTSGFRAVNKRFIGIFADDYSKDYPEPEAIVTTKMYGGRILEMPVVMKEREAGSSSITLWKSVYYMVKVTLAIFVKRLSYGIRREK